MTMVAAGRWQIFVRYAAAVMGLFLLLTACSEVPDVKPGNISNITLREIRDRTIRLDVDLTIVNNSSRRIVVRKLISDIMLDAGKIGTVTVEKKVVIHPGTVQEYSVPVKIEHESFGRIGKILLGSLFHGGRINLEMKGTLYVRSGIWMKKIRFDRKQEVPLMR